MVKMKAIISLILIMASMSAGHAQDNFMFVFLNTNQQRKVLPQTAVDSLQKGHLANITKLAREDKLHVAGPFHGGGGIFILNTTSLDSASKWISTDPAISAGRFKIEILPWTPRIGSICLVDEESEMVEYTFVRFNTHITKFNVQEAPEWFMKHDKFINDLRKTGNIVSEGIFDNSDGSTLVMKGALQKEVILSDPAVMNGILQPDIKTIWVGKGSFCEK